MKPLSIDRFSLLLACLLAFLGCVFRHLPSHAQDLAAVASKPAPVPEEPIDLDDLPDPPAAIKELIKTGDVSFCTGRIPWSEMRDARDRTGVAGTRYRLAAETRAEFSYDYRSRIRWRNRSVDGKRSVSVTVRFSSADLKVVHVIWFRHPPAPEHFWNDTIVQHEFDHVRLSTDPMIEKLFARKLKECSQFRHELSDDEKVNEDFVNQLVRERVKESFDEISELVKIRYKELDRVTRHGLEPIPKDSKLAEWLARDEITLDEITREAVDGGESERNTPQ